MIEVFMFSSKEDDYLLRKSILSFNKLYASPLYFKVVSDGTLDSHETLPRLAKNVEIIDSKTLKNAAQHILRGRPRLRGLCERLPVARKIILAAVLPESNRANFLDSDVIAIRHCEGVFEKDIGNYFMDNGYTMISVPWRHAAFVRDVYVTASINSGVFSIDKAAINFDLIESILGDKRLFSGSKFHVEQTLWSIIDAQWRLNGGKSYLFHPQNISFPKINKRNDENTAILHFTRPNRKNISAICQEKTGYIKVETKSTQTLTASRYIIERGAQKTLRLARSAFN